MPGVVHPPTRLTPDAFEMPKADDDFHLRVSGGSVASPAAYGRTSVDPNLDLLREIKGAVDPRKFNTGRALANPVSRASPFFASESIPSAASKTRRSLPCANCKSTVKKASEYII
jgi:hypothetical protein